jgi:hypothetical protein
MNYDQAVAMVFQCGRAERMERFLSVLDGCAEWTDQQRWTMLREVWEDTEGAGHYLQFWQALWNGPRCEHAMTDDERAALAATPDQITIYRGVSDHWGHGCKRHCGGLSWTFDRDKALWFAKRFTAAPTVGWLATVTLPKSMVRAYLTGREEAEVIVLPRDLPRLRIETIAGLDRGGVVATTVTWPR